MNVTLVDQLTAFFRKTRYLSLEKRASRFLLSRLNEHAAVQKAREACFAFVGSAPITANRKSTADLDKLDRRPELLHQSFAVIDAVPIAAPAIHIDLFRAIILQPRPRHCAILHSGQSF
ncbi:hypothetical protein [Agrobacterium tumefaciens]|uniref:hypothetical protein n=1 Tax=Agrobacterium TaxID=357 RepID=UPI0009D4FB56|nr:hypothetical protein AGR6A_pb0016 [Agrobacterium sp. NCPPB 925]